MANRQLDSFVVNMYRILYHNTGYKYYKNEKLEIIKIVLEEMFLDMDGFCENVLIHEHFISTVLRNFIMDMRKILIENGDFVHFVTYKTLYRVNDVLSVLELRQEYSLCERLDIRHLTYTLLDIISNGVISHYEPKNIELYTFIFNTIATWLIAYRNDAGDGEKIIVRLVDKFVEAYKYLSHKERINRDVYNSVCLMRTGIITYCNDGGFGGTKEMTKNGATIIVPKTKTVKYIEETLYEGIFKEYQTYNIRTEDMWNAK